MSAKADEFFEGSYFIGIDMDENSFPTSHSLVSRLSLPPTFWYTSFSHMQTDEKTGQSKGVRIRLIYVFDQMITDKYYFRYCSWILHKMIEGDIEEPIKDDCGMRCTQYFNGTNCGDANLVVESGLSNNIYSLSDISISDEGYYHFLLSGCHYKTIDREKREAIQKRINNFSNRSFFSHSNITPTNLHPHPQLISAWEKNERFIEGDCICDFDEELLRDSCCLPWEVFYDMYKHIYPYVYRLERDEWFRIGDIKYQLCDEDYLELLWIPQRITDGHHRRHTLFHRAWLRRLIMPSISPSTILFNLLVDRYRFFDNTDRVLSLSLLKEKVRESFILSIDELKQKYSTIYESTKDACKNKKFIIHKSCRKKVNAMSIKKELKWKILDEIYDIGQTFNYNLQILNDSDFPIDDNTLYRYCMDRGIKIKTSRTLKYEKFKDLHQSGMSIREEQSYLKSLGLDLSTSTLSGYIKKLQSEPKDT